MMIRLVSIGTEATSMHATAPENPGHDENMRRVLIAAGIAALLVLIWVVYWRSHSGDRLEVDPHARKEIEKAKGR